MLVERYEAVHALHKNPKISISENLKTYTFENVSACIDPFQVCSTNIEATKRYPNDTLRLTFECGRQKYRIDVPASKPGSQRFVPLVQDPRFELTCVYLSTESFLTVFDSANLNCWMKNLKDETPLSALSIPGTHNTPCYRRALPSVRCQAVNAPTQLQNGVRFFDVRVQPEGVHSRSLALVHSVFPVAIKGTRYFCSLVHEIYSYLSENPSESVIMSVKREGNGSWEDRVLGRILFDHYTNGKDASRWYTDPSVPNLGTVRGKIVLMRRFAIDEALQRENGGRGWAIDADDWEDNTPHDLHGSVCVQDFYEVLEAYNVEKKIAYAKQHLERAASCVCHLPGITTDRDYPVPPDPFYLNFLSASNFWRRSCWPERIAAKLNPAICSSLCCEHARKTEGDGSTGIVVCDWVGLEGDWDLVRCIVAMNSRLMMREMTL